MNSKIIFSSLANYDFENILSHYYELNKGTAKKYYTGIINLIKKLQKFPMMGRVVPECQDIFYDKYRELIYEHYRIVYRTESDNIFIIRIFDARMDVDFSLID